MKENFAEIYKQMSDKEDLMARALENIAQAVEISDKMTIKVKDISSTDVETLRSEMHLLQEIGNKLSIFQDYWKASFTKGKTAIQTDIGIKGSIDMKLFLTGKLDLNQMKKILIRFDCSNSAIKGINTLQFSIDGYKIFSEKLGDADCVTSALITQELIELQRSIIEQETKELNTQLQNVNIFYQNKMLTRTTKIAYLSLIVALLAFFLTILPILQLLHIM